MVLFNHKLMKQTRGKAPFAAGKGAIAAVDEMIREIVKDQFLLSRVSEPAAAEDLQTVADLTDTLNAHRDGCVGMAANMIGVLKRIIVFDDNGSVFVMLNPEIIKASGKYTAEEGCLSLEGSRAAERYRTVKVRYQNEAMQLRIKS